MLDLPVIESEAIENLRALNPGDNDEFLREIVGIFLDDTPQRITELERSLKELDLGTFTRAAHSIKGSSANLGAQRLRAVAETLEHDSRVHGLVGLTERVADLKLQFSQAEAELKKIAGTG